MTVENDVMIDNDDATVDDGVVKIENVIVPALPTYIVASFPGHCSCVGSGCI